MARSAVIMLSYLTTALGVEYKPGDPAPRPGDDYFDDTELGRLIEVGAAREFTEEDAKALAAKGPTVAEYVAAGYAASSYPPAGYESRSTPEEIAAAISAQEQAATDKAAADAAAAAKGKK